MSKENNSILAIMKISRLIWKIGLPMILSMILQAIYNVVDTIFVINMPDRYVDGVLVENSGVLANLALTASFPVQIFIIAIGVGTGVGVAAMLSRRLGQGDKEGASTVCGNAIFLAIVIYAIFLLFGLFGAEAFISLQSSNPIVIKWGASYLRICCCLSMGSVGYTVFERFLIGTGRTNYSMWAQISGALLNVLLDYVFVYPCNLGVEGAAWATIIGQIVSLLVAMIFHYTKDKEINPSLKYLKPTAFIGKIYKVGLPAAIMQALLSIMMLATNLILGTSNPAVVDTVVGSFGIYYKIQQIALFACFGLSNALITIVSFNNGMKNKQRVIDSLKWGIIDGAILGGIITILFEALAYPLAKLFGLASTSSSAQIVEVTTLAIRIASIGYVFMGVTQSIAGVFQGLRRPISPVITALLRLIVFLLPVVYLFTLTGENVIYTFWWSFPIAEILTLIVTIFMLIYVWKVKISKIGEIKPMEEAKNSK